jgi:hypothetical protein
MHCVSTIPNPTRRRTGAPEFTYGRKNIFLREKKKLYTGENLFSYGRKFGGGEQEYFVVLVSNLID